MRSSRLELPNFASASASASALDLILAPRPVPLVMGVVNVTPDSFYAASRFPSREAAVERALQMAEEGAELFDVGGESTRPGSDGVTEAEELSRTIPVLEALAARLRAPLSIDTSKAAVARAALAAGASILNDVSALRQDSAMAEAARGFEAVILMHRGGGGPKTMQKRPSYEDVVAEVFAFLRERKAAFAAAGGDCRRVLVDPGIGFGKDLGHNLSLIKHVAEFSKLGPVVLGVSRKSFLGGIHPDRGPEERLEGSLACACWSALAGVRVLRVHDVRETRRALEVLAAVGNAR